MVLDIETVHHILKNTANVNKPFVYITDLTSPLISPLHSIYLVYVCHLDRLVEVLSIILEQ